MSGSPTLSVLVPNFNHGRHLPESLGAILGQSYRPLEIIVADDCSTDGSREVLENIARTTGRIRLVANTRNLGAVGNSNRLLELASGDYVYFASADDRVLPGLFERSMRMLEQHPQAGLCSTLARMMDPSGDDCGLYRSRIVSASPAFLSPAQCLATLRWHGNWIVGCTLFIRRRAVLEAGGFIEELGPFIDGFTQQVVALRSGACFIPQALGCWRATPSGYSAAEGRNCERYLEYLGHMLDLMRTRYADLFPSDYIDVYERECLFGAAANARRVMNSACDVYVDRLERALSPVTRFDRILIRAVRSSIRLQTCVMNGYVFARRRRITWEMVRRWSGCFARAFGHRAAHAAVPARTENFDASRRAP